MFKAPTLHDFLSECHSSRTSFILARNSDPPNRLNSESYIQLWTYGIFALFEIVVYSSVQDRASNMQCGSAYFFCHLVMELRRQLATGIDSRRFIFFFLNRRRFIFCQRRRSKRIQSTLFYTLYIYILSKRFGRFFMLIWARSCLRFFPVLHMVFMVDATRLLRVCKCDWSWSSFAYLFLARITFHIWLSKLLVTFKWWFCQVIRSKRGCWSGNILGFLPTSRLATFSALWQLLQTSSCRLVNNALLFSYQGKTLPFCWGLWNKDENTVCFAKKKRWKYSMNRKKEKT